MRYKYSVIKGIYTNNEGEEYTAYGVVLFKKSNKRYTAIKIVQDIFFDYKKAKDFVVLCNRNELSPIHLDDVIEDIL